ncbi:MAG: hypothetical protein JWN82_666 [Candidatus Saccharibacteria bacterium]|nr:hypothetical protein [Candidatus Saccharibacteria bacterium]
MSHDALERTLRPDQKEKLAKKIDEDMQAIARHLPWFVKKAASGLVHTLCEVPEVGRLEGMYMGNFAVRILAVGEDTGWYQDFDLVDYHRAHGGVPVPKSGYLTSPEELGDCPIEPEKLGQLVGTLRDFYTRQNIDEHIANFETGS